MDQKVLIENPLVLKGTVSISGGEELKNDLQQLIDSAEKPELDISEVEQIDLCALQLIWAAQKSAEEAGKVLRISAFSKACLDAAKLCGLRSVLSEANK